MQCVALAALPGPAILLHLPPAHTTAGLRGRRCNTNPLPAGKHRVNYERRFCSAAKYLTIEVNGRASIAVYNRHMAPARNVGFRHKGQHWNLFVFPYSNAVAAHGDAAGSMTGAVQAAALRWIQGVIVGVGVRYISHMHTGPEHDVHFRLRPHHNREIVGGLCHHSWWRSGKRSRTPDCFAVLLQQCESFPRRRRTENQEARAIGLQLQRHPGKATILFIERCRYHTTR